MNIYLTHGSTTRDVTNILSAWTWSGDKAAISRQLSADFAYIEGSSLPVPEVGDLLTMADGEKKLFIGVILLRTLGSEDSTLSCTAYDYGYYLQRNDGTYKFTGAPAEAITRTACADRGIPVASLPSTGIPLRRKFAAVRLSQLITTAWTLVSEKNGKSYAIRYTPDGLLVKERSANSSSLVLKASSNLMDATTKEDASKMVNSVAIYDSSGNFIRRYGDASAQKLYGRFQRTVTVNVLGDHSLITGETVVVREAKTGLSGVFWIDADVHTWKRGNYYAKLTLNCRNVMATASAGSEDL